MEKNDIFQFGNGIIGKKRNELNVWKIVNERVQLKQSCLVRSERAAEVSFVSSENRILKRKGTT